MRGKKKLARNAPSGNFIDSDGANPLHGLAFKLTPLSASAIASDNHGIEASPGASFKFMAAYDDGVGIDNGGEGDRTSSGDQR